MLSLTHEELTLEEDSFSVMAFLHNCAEKSKWQIKEIDTRLKIK
jgi:hypothetical protein